MEISKSVTFKTLEEGAEFIQKLKKKEGIIRINFNGNIDKEHGVEVFGVTWVVDEELEA